MFAGPAAASAQPRRTHAGLDVRQSSLSSIPALSHASLHAALPGALSPVKTLRAFDPERMGHRVGALVDHGSAS